MAVLIIVTITPILFVEMGCRGSQQIQKKPVYLTDSEHHRPETRTLLTYPEWHIVYAYEGYAETLTNSAPHSFPFSKAVFGFWSSLCALTQEADKLGEIGVGIKSTIYTIGVSFTFEMAIKAFYEESLGRLFSLTSHSVQDDIERDMAHEYARFLNQTPWYKFDFDAWQDTLSAAPKPSLRAWERFIILSIEWKVKAAYAKLIAKAVDSVGPDETTMLIAYSGAVEIGQKVRSTGDVNISKVDRYRAFTDEIQAKLGQDLTILEIAGNDQILISVVGQNYGSQSDFQVIYETKRIGFEDKRFLLLIQIPSLITTSRKIQEQGAKVEHIYDY